MNETSVSFVVLAFRNSVTEIKALFASLQKGAAAAGIPSACVLVSNDETFDGSLIPEAKVCAGHGNVGFAKGIRIGVEAAESEFVVIANPDLRITVENASRFVSQLVTQPGVLVPLLLNGRGEIAHSSYEDFVFSSGLLAAKHACKRFVSRGTRRELPRWVRICGAFVGMSTALAKEYGPFDDAFFMYGEDRDLTRRLRQGKVPIRLAGDISVTHIGGGSGGGMNRELAVLRADSALRLAFRRYGRLGVRVKAVDLWLVARRKHGQARVDALAARRSAVAHWRSTFGEAPRLDISSLAAETRYVGR